MKVSVVITSFKEPETIGGAVEAVLDQADQVIVVAPDKETLAVAKKRGAKLIQDKGKGKAAALNLSFGKVRHEIVVLTDGDVWVEKKAISQLIKPFSDTKVGIVSGRPVPVNDKKTLFGFWAYLLTEAAHQWRSQSKNFDCSGYLLAIQKKLLTKIPVGHLAEDAFLSRWVRQKGFKTAYAPKAKVYVKFPANFSDWLKQKVRSVGGAGRGMGGEVKNSLKLFSFCQNPREVFYLILLFLARAYLWLLIFWKIKIKKHSASQIWQRVETTKH